MTYSMINGLAAISLFLWAGWCVLSRRVRAGVFGIFVYACAGIAALSVAFGPGYGYRNPPAAELAMNVSFACVAVRHMLLVLVRPRWVRLKKRMRNFIRRNRYVRIHHDME